MLRTSERTLVLVALAGAGVLGGCAGRTPERPPPPAAAVAEGPRGAAAVMTATATVQDIDQRTRMVTLLTSDGERVRFRADERVQNLPQVRKGDQVTATYYESIAVALREPGAGRPGVTVTEESDRAARGAMPGGTAVRTVTLTAKVTDVDRKRQRVTLEGPEGEPVTLKVQDPRNLERVDEGDLVEATYREAVAVSVERPSK